ncbi:D-alanyl-D-alanine carboxypeptidase/D-alanyl-D-alanine-endopeptidase [Actinotignum schaalii]|uniref:D-alanyl-D-alanine carboxypeptidase/D-alanyl-D-alanine-endopeptidase n=1 Tax=Actinotignum schaalii TaxID=59505 RepID=UPI00047BFEAD|nr:D-alanyl-D-alanine carboxypeptidase [Actinotignum schaalii]AIE83186.1 hypothetical protein FB03_07995 [Actinotignum schaalii]WQN45380.1 D-alanyl-D-alanine carboxypeptidase [Actinotignum schaalii]
MKGKAQIALSLVLLLAGGYAFADAFDLTPGLLTLGPRADAAAPYPHPTPVPAVTVPAAPEPAELEDVSAAKVAALGQEFAARLAPTGQVSYEIREAATGRVLASKDAKTPRVPASNMKLVTARVALETLGPDRRFATSVAASGSTIHLIGGGDVFLALDTAAPQVPGTIARGDLSELAAAAATYAREHPGGPVSVVVDTSLFAGPEYAPTLDPVNHDYVAPITPIAMNGGAVGYHYSATPALDAGNVLAEQLRGAGVEVAEVRAGQAPKEAAAHPLATVHSASVRELVDRMLTESDNTLAETLGHLVARERGESADFAGAARATHAVLEELGYPLEGVVVSDNSGLSETNRLTCVLQLAILEDVVNLSDGTVGALGAGLPVAALNGTLADRLTEGAAPGMIRGKTGTLADVVSLSGVLRTRSGALLTFSILTDSHHDVSLLDVRAAEDAFLTAVAEL